MKTWFLPLLKGTCPHCKQAPIFHSLFGMNEDCAACGIHFERESGYFSMSIFIAYVMAAVISLPLMLLVYLLQLASHWYYLVPSIFIVLLIPPLFRYSRIIWLYLDEWLDPRDTPI